MKANTHVWIGIRNVGTSDSPLTFEGTVSESIMWLAQSLGTLYMKNSLQIGIARTRDEMLARLDMKRGMSLQKSEELQALLASVLPEGDDSDEVGSEPNSTHQHSLAIQINSQSPKLAEKLEGDDWVEPA